MGRVRRRPRHPVSAVTYPGDRSTCKSFAVDTLFSADKRMTDTSCFFFVVAVVAEGKKRGAVQRSILTDMKGADIFPRHRLCWIPNP